MALPNSNISTSLVGQTLGTSSRDVGTLCTHPNINKWSKWKPVRHNSVNPITKAELKSVNFGFYIPDATSNIATAESGKWQYQKPRGGQYNEPFRLGDFRNYENNCVNPVVIESHNSTIDIFDVFLFNLPFYVLESNNGQLLLSDFDKIKDMYVGAIFTRGSDNYIQTATRPISEIGWQFYVNPLESPFGSLGRVIARLIVSDTKVEAMRLLNGNEEFIPLPIDNNRIAVDIKNTYVTTSFAAGGRDGSSLQPIALYDFEYLKTNGDLAILARFTNTHLSENGVFDATKFKLMTDKLFLEDVYYEMSADVTVSGSPVASVIVPKDDDLLVLFTVENFLNRYADGSLIPLPPVGSKIKPTIELVYDGIIMTSREIMIECVY